MDIKKGDQVKILSGKDHGKSGAVLRVLPKEARVAVEGLNLYKKRVRPRAAGAKGEMVSLPRAVPAGTVMLVCPHCKRPTRVGHIRAEGGRTMRLCKKCKASF